MDAGISGGGGVVRSGSGAVPSLPPPCPRSPPEYPDLYGKRRESARSQMLEREIGFLEEELKSVEGLEPASRCCKEVVDFSIGNSDPLIPTYRKSRRSCGGFWKWLWSGMSWLNFSWVCCCCCYTFCPPDLNLPCHRPGESCIRCPKCECRCPKCECCCPECKCRCPECECRCPECECRCPECECRCPECECRCPNCSFPRCPLSSCCRLRLSLPKWSRPSCCCRRSRCSCCWVPRIPRICGCCPWNQCSCGNCQWDCSCRRGWCRRRSCCLAWPKCSCDWRCSKCWCPELPKKPCSCFSCRGLCCINPCYYCY